MSQSRMLIKLNVPSRHTKVSGFRPNLLYKGSFKCYFSTRVEKTLLHSFIQNSNSYGQLVKFVQKNTLSKVAEMAVTVDEFGKAPLEYIDDNYNWYNEEGDKVKDALIEIIASKKSKSLNQMLNVDEIIKNYYPNLDSATQYALKLSGSAINFARSIVNYSTTHPNFNLLNESKQDQIFSTIKTMRSQYIEYSPSDYTKVCKKSGVGNCHELSFIAIDYILKKSRQALVVNATRIVNGDHVFVVFGEKLSNDMNDYLAKDHPKTYFCCPWSGAFGFFKRAEAKKKLGDFKNDFRSDGRNFNYIVKFDPLVHLLARDPEDTVFKTNGNALIKR